MISIRPYLNIQHKAEEALTPLVQLLIEGIEHCAIEGPPGASGDASPGLRERTQEFLAALGSGVPPSELLEPAARAMDALRRHNDQAVKHLTRPIAELHAKVKLLTAAITAVSSTSDENISRLRQIKVQLIGPVNVREIHLLRSRLSECLDGVLAEAERQRDESIRAAEHLNRRASQLLNPAASGAESSAADRATGLPARDQAEEAIAQACQDETPAFVVVMAVNQLQTLNRSFGDEIGDAILHRFAAFIRENLPAADQLFRWTGPTVVSLVRRKAVHQVRAAIEPLLSRKLGHIVTTGTGEVHVPISARWIVVPLMASPRLLFHKIDAFVGIE